MPSKGALYRAMSVDYDTQKLYSSDTGFFVTQAFMDAEYTENELYRALMLDKLSINNGMLAETAACQRHASLDKFIRKVSDRLGTPYILYTKDVMRKNGIVHFPLYMVSFLCEGQR